VENVVKRAQGVLAGHPEDEGQEEEKKQIVAKGN
jgi:transketolase